MDESRQDRSNKAIAYGMAAVLCWSTVATAFKLTLAYLEPPQLVLLAAIFSFLSLWGLLVLQGKGGLLWRAILEYPIRSGGLGLINPLAYYLVLFEAYDRLPAQVAQPVNYTWALTLPIMAAIFLKQRLRGVDILAAGVAYAGVVVLSMQGEWGNWGRVDGLGLGLALFSTIIWASYWLLAASDNRDPVAGLAANFACSLPGCALMCVVLSPTLKSAWEISWKGLAGAAYIGCVEMGLTFALWGMALRLAERAAQVSTLIFLSPPISLVLIHLFLGEPIHGSTFVGLALVLAGLGLQQAGKRGSRLNF